jgi:protein-tyrosine-phosphatase
MGRKKDKDGGRKKTSILFVDEKNDLQSQIAEYFLVKLYGDAYEVRSAGPKYDFIDCDLVSMMYQSGHDIRREISKDFTAKNMIEYDYIVFLQKATHDRIREVIPFDGKQILKDFGSREDFKAADDLELVKCYSDLVESVKSWVKETFSSLENLEKLAARPSDQAAGSGGRGAGSSGSGGAGTGSGS